MDDNPLNDLVFVKGFDDNVWVWDGAGWNNTEV
jgi:hypothetical protein